MNEDDMALEVLDFNKEHLARVKPYFTEESYSHLQRQGYIEFSVRSAVMFMRSINRETGSVIHARHVTHIKI